MQAVFSILLLIVLFVFPYSTSASYRYPRPMAFESKIKTLSYDPNAIHVYTGYYGIQSSIVFDEGETIENMVMGDTAGWQLVPSENRLFLKPMEDDINTNVTIITNRRLYHFEFKAAEPNEENAKDIAYEVRMVYNDPNSGKGDSMGIIGDYNDTVIPDIITDTAKLNFDYKISGSNKIAPLMVFDDGEFTYIRFASINAEIPAIFLVDSTGHESLVNVKSIEDFMVIERVDAVFTLRWGEEIVCLFNERMHLEVVKEEKAAQGILSRKK